MKTLFTLITFCFFYSCPSFSQYSVVYSSENYTNLVNADTIDESATFQFYSLPIYLPVPLGFGFEINGEVFDSVALAQRGFAMFRDVDPKYSISIFDCNLKDFNDDPMNSPILYSTEGSVGNRIFKCEYKLQGFVEDQENDDYVSFQLWLYEECNQFQIRIGDYQINSDVFLNNFPAPYFGLGDYNNSANNQVLLGSPLNPTISDSNMAHLDTVPPVNTMYTFSNCVAGIQELNQLFSIYPNPVKDKLFISSEFLTEDVEIDVFDVSGTKVYASSFLGKSGNNEINLGQLSSGTYVLVIRSQGKLSNHKIIKY